MSTFDAANWYFSGQGVIMIGRRDPVTGNPIGLRPVGNCPEMRLTVGTTVVNHKGSQDGQRATDARLQTEVNVTASITVENWNAKNLAEATRGSDTLIPAGTGYTEEVMGFPGLVTGLRYLNLSNVVVRKGGTALVEYSTTVEPGKDPWDYKLNAAAGSIMLNDGILADFSAYVPESPALPEGDVLTAAYDYEEHYIVDALTRPITDNWLRFEGLNTVEENSPVIVDVFRFSNDPLKELALLSDTFGQFVIEGSVLKDDTRLFGSNYFSIKKLKAAADNAF
jgi:hypothetical protein